MRRLLAILLLAVMPLQFSWAAVESYCALEAPVEVEHFGHHEHLQAAVDAVDAVDVVDSADPSADLADPASDGDCSHCHCHCPAMLGAVSAFGHAVPGARPSPALDAAGHAHAPARPERPQWRPLA